MTDKSKSASVRAKINNFAKAKNLSPQIVLQTYMIERILERIAMSKYQDKFIIKGGFLVSHTIGVENRMTADLDANITQMEFSKELLSSVLGEILAINIEDDMQFKISSVENIRESAEYDGFRFHIVCNYFGVTTPLKLDI